MSGAISRNEVTVVSGMSGTISRNEDRYAKPTFLLEFREIAPLIPETKFTKLAGFFLSFLVQNKFWTPKYN